MPRRVHWHNVIPGLIALAVVIALALGVIFFARVGALHGDTFTLYVTADAARGVIPGTQVWLAGQKVGLVDEIQFRPLTADTSRRLLLKLSILEKYQEHIRHDAQYQIRAGGTLIGAQVLSISVGSSGAPMVQDGDTIDALPQGDTEELASQFAFMSRELPGVVDNLKRLRALLGSGEGSVGADRAMASLAPVQQRVTALTAEQDGTLGRLTGDHRLLERAGRIVARIDSIRTLLASEETSLGRFRRDSTLLREIAAVRGELSVIRTLIDSASGTAGRLVKDEAIQNELSALERAMAQLADDIAKDPLRYIVF